MRSRYRSSELAGANPYAKDRRRAILWRLAIQVDAIFAAGPEMSSCSRSEEASNWPFFNMPLLMGLPSPRLRQFTSPRMQDVGEIVIVFHESELCRVGRTPIGEQRPPLNPKIAAIHASEALVFLKPRCALDARQEGLAVLICERRIRKCAREIWRAELSSHRDFAR
jgi:hypothetical protein